MSMTVVAGAVRVPPRARASAPVSVFASWWDPRGVLLRLALVRAGVAHRCVDPTTDATARDLPALQGAAPTPIVSMDGEWLTRPSLAELEDALRRHDLVRPPEARRDR